MHVRVIQRVEGSAPQHHRQAWRSQRVLGHVIISPDAHPCENSMFAKSKKGNHLAENLPASPNMAALKSHCKMANPPQRPHTATPREVLCSLIVESSPHVSDFSSYAILSWCERLVKRCSVFKLQNHVTHGFEILITNLELTGQSVLSESSFTWQKPCTCV
jgi:hypothetical protein